VKTLHNIHGNLPYQEANPYIWIRFALFFRKEKETEQNQAQTKHIIYI
jgi:hypothetical protein